MNNKNLSNKIKQMEDELELLRLSYLDLNDKFSEDSQIRNNNSNDYLNVVHMEMNLVQNCIARVAGYSFAIRGWVLAFIVAILTFNDFSKLDNNRKIMYAVLLIIFWVLDAHFLRVERLFVGKYNWIVKNRAINKLSDQFLYDLNPYNDKMIEKSSCKKYSLIGCFFSIRLCPYYLFLLYIYLINAF